MIKTISEKSYTISSIDDPGIQCILALFPSLTCENTHYKTSTEMI